jgi:hypothetical protein
VRQLDAALRERVEVMHGRRRRTAATTAPPVAVEHVGT